MKNISSTLLFTFVVITVLLASSFVESRRLVPKVQYNSIRSYNISDIEYKLSFGGTQQDSVVSASLPTKWFSQLTVTLHSTTMANYYVFNAQEFEKFKNGSTTATPIIQYKQVPGGDIVFLQLSSTNTKTLTLQDDFSTDRVYLVVASVNVLPHEITVDDFSMVVLFPKWLVAAVIGGLLLIVAVLVSCCLLLTACCCYCCCGRSSTEYVSLNSEKVPLRTGSTSIDRRSSSRYYNRYE